jgi:hypothetical protein
MLARMVEGPVSYLEVCMRGPVTEESMARVFEGVRVEIVRHQAKRVLVDGREISVALTISDMYELAKTVGVSLAGTVDRFALVLRQEDILSEKFFEPSVTHRGLPTLVTADLDEAVFWITSKLRPPR